LPFVSGGADPSSLAGLSQGDGDSRNGWATLSGVVALRDRYGPADLCLHRDPFNDRQAIGPYDQLRRSLAAELCRSTLRDQRHRFEQHPAAREVRMGTRLRRGRPVRAASSTRRRASAPATATPYPFITGTAGSRR